MDTGTQGKEGSKARAILLGELRPQKKAEVSLFRGLAGQGAILVSILRATESSGAPLIRLPGE